MIRILFHFHPMMENLLILPVSMVCTLWWFLWNSSLTELSTTFSCCPQFNYCRWSHCIKYIILTFLQTQKLPSSITMFLAICQSTCLVEISDLTCWVFLFTLLRSLDDEYLQQFSFCDSVEINTHFHHLSHCYIIGFFSMQKMFLIYAISLT